MDIINYDCLAQLVAITDRVQKLSLKMPHDDLQKLYTLINIATYISKYPYKSLYLDGKDRMLSCGNCAVDLSHFGTIKFPGPIQYVMVPIPKEYANYSDVYGVIVAVDGKTTSYALSHAVANGYYIDIRCIAESLVYYLRDLVESGNYSFSNNSICAAGNYTNDHLICMIGGQKFDVVKRIIAYIENACVRCGE